MRFRAQYSSREHQKHDLGEIPACMVERLFNLLYRGKAFRPGRGQGWKQASRGIAHQRAS